MRRSGCSSQNLNILAPNSTKKVAVKGVIARVNNADHRSYIRWSVTGLSPSGILVAAENVKPTKVPTAIPIAQLLRCLLSIFTFTISCNRFKFASQFGECGQKCLMQHDVLATLRVLCNVLTVTKATLMIGLPDAATALEKSTKALP